MLTGTDWLYYCTSPPPLSLSLSLSLSHSHILSLSSTAKDEELSHHQREYERLQRQLQQRLLQVEEELAVQKQQLMNQFDDLSRRQEHEHRVKVHIYLTAHPPSVCVSVAYSS